MFKHLIINSFASLCLLFVGFIILGGILHNDKMLINYDKLIFPNLKDKRVLFSADQLDFVICFIFSLIAFLNGIITSLFPIVPNKIGILLPIFIIISYPIRIIFIIFYKNKKYEDIPRIWPFKKEKIEYEK